MAKAPAKGVAGTLQEILTNLQTQVKDRTLELEAANKKIAELSKGAGPDLSGDIKIEKIKREEAQKAFKESQEKVAVLEKEVAEAKSAVPEAGASSAELEAEIVKRTLREKDLAERTEELLSTNKKLVLESDARRAADEALKVAQAELAKGGSGAGASDVMLKSEVERFGTIPGTSESWAVRVLSYSPSHSIS